MDTATVESKYERTSAVSGGRVWRGRERATGRAVILKEVERVGTELPQEAAVMRDVRHPNVVELVDVVDEGGYRIVLVTEDVGYDVYEVLQRKRRPLSEGEAKHLLKQLLQGLDAVHAKGYVHGDMKTHNLLLSQDGKLSITDFGIAQRQVLSPESQTAPLTTLWYRSPESLLGSEECTTASDMWSVGCVFAELLLGRPLFQGVDGDIQMVDRLFQYCSTPTESSWPGFSNLAYVQAFRWNTYEQESISALMEPPQTTAYCSKAGLDLLHKLLTCNPLGRPDTGTALLHPWFKELPEAQAPPLHELLGEIR